jgi:hypothetical protein
LVRHLSQCFSRATIVQADGVGQLLVGKSHRCGGTLLGALQISAGQRRLCLPILCPHLSRPSQWTGQP